MSLLPTISFSLLAIVASLHANEENSQNSQTFHGPTTIYNQDIDNVNIHGPAYVNDSHVKSATVNGPIFSKNSTFATLDVRGPAHFTGVTVTDNMNITGPLNADNSHLNQVTITSDELTLKNTEIKNLLVKANGEGKELQRVFLDHGAKVDSITFESKNGRVFLNDPTALVKTLEGGQTIQISK